jgi:hypothetical protein
MKLNNIIKALSLRLLQGEGNLVVEVAGGYTSDLLSDVMARGRKKDIWITLQTHQNIVAVAKLRELAAVILVNGRNPDSGTLRKAKEEKVILLGTDDSAFSISAKLYEILRVVSF